MFLLLFYFANGHFYSLKVYVVLSWTETCSLTLSTINDHEIERTYTKRIKEEEFKTRKNKQQQHTRHTHEKRIEKCWPKTSTDRMPTFYYFVVIFRLAQKPNSERTYSFTYTVCDQFFFSLTTSLGSVVLRFGAPTNKTCTLRHRHRLWHWM